MKYGMACHISQGCALGMLWSTDVYARPNLPPNLFSEQESLRSQGPLYWHLLRARQHLRTRQSHRNEKLRQHLSRVEGAAPQPGTVSIAMMLREGADCVELKMSSGIGCYPWIP